MTRAGTLSLLAGALMSLTARAGEADQTPLTLEKLMGSLGERRPGSAKFVEQKYLKILKSPLESRGTLSYKPPNRLEKITDFPRTESLVVDDDKVTLETPRFRRVISLREYPTVRAFVESIRATLKGDLATLRKVYETSLSGGSARWQLSLVPADPAMQAVIKRVLIGGSADRVQSVEIQEADGDRSVMTVSEDGR
jgi:outer membrane lipoprotein-sorting protein